MIEGETIALAAVIKQNEVFTAESLTPTEAHLESPPKYYRYHENKISEYKIIIKKMFDDYDVDLSIIDNAKTIANIIEIALRFVSEIEG